MARFKKSHKASKAGVVFKTIFFLSSTSPVYAFAPNATVTVAPTGTIQTSSGHSHQTGLGAFSSPPASFNHSNLSGRLHNDLGALQRSVFVSSATQPTSAYSGARPTLGGLGVSLNLASSSTDIVLGANLFKSASSATIDVGGVSQTFTAGQRVTAAEYIAVKEILAGKSQSLTITNSGIADAGSFNLNLVGPHTSLLVVPAGVTGLDYFSANKNFNLSGVILDYGSILGVSTNAHITAGTISAQNITVESGGLISTQLPNSLLGSIANDVAGLSLTLCSSNNIANAGTISSFGALTLIANQGSIANLHAAGAPTPVINATGNINLNAGSGNFSNAGFIASNKGNVNLSAPDALDVNIAGQGGTFQATSGNINVRDASYAGSANINISGGNYLSQNLNLYAGSGNINGNVGQISGQLNTVASNEHMLAATNNLILNNNTIQNDPTFINTAPGGTITITGSNDFSSTTQPVTILANGDITTAGSGQIVDHGGNVIIIAGALTTVTGTGGTTTGIPGNDLSNSGANPGNTATVDLSQGNGGNIDFHTGALATVIDTSSTSGNGGSVTLAAFANGNTGGQVLLGSNGINTQSSNPGSNGGAVTIIAGALTASAVTAGAITTGGAGGTAGGPAGTGGSVTIITAQPMTTTPGVTTLVSFDTTGNYSSSAQVQTAASAYSALINANGGVTVIGDINTTGSGGQGSNATAGGSGAIAGGITISAGSNVSTQNLLAYGAGGGGGGDQANGGAGGSGANIAVTSATGTITVNQAINSSGGGGGGAGGGDGASTTPTSGGTGGAAGTITLNGAGTVSIAGSILAASGTSGGAGGAGDGAGNGGGGGGGGASFGGGGGAGGGGAGSVAGGAGGGGGGGFFGGGGGGGNSNAAGTGGSGGGYSFGTGGDNGGNGASLSGGVGGTSGPTPGSGEGNGMSGTGGGGAGAAQAGQPSAPSGITTGSAAIQLTGGGIQTATSGIGPVYGSTIQLSSPVTGGITINDSLLAATSVKLSSNSGSITQASGVEIITPALSAGSVTGAIGAPLLPITTTASTIAAGTGGSASVYVSDSAATTVTIQTIGSVTNKAGGTYSVTATGANLTNSSAIGGSTITLTSQTGSVTVGAAVTASSQVNISSAASITNTSGISNISAPGISLDSTGGNITLSSLNATGPIASITVTANPNGTGAISIPNTTAMSLNFTLTADAGSGGITIGTLASDVIANSSGAVSIGDHSASVTVGGTTDSPNTGSSFSVSSSPGALSTSGTITATTVSLSSQRGALTLGASVSGSTSVSITSASSITTADISSYISSPSISLSSTGGSITLTSPLSTTGSTGSISLSTNHNGSGSITASSLDTQTLTIFAGSGGTAITATTAGNVIANSTGPVNITASNSAGVTIGGTTNSGNTAGTILPSGFTVVNTAGDVNNSGPISASTTVTLTSQAGNVNVNNTISGTAITLTSQTGSVTLGANVSGTSSVNLTAATSIDAITNGLAHITSPSITLNSTGGNITIDSAGLTASNSITLIASPGGTGTITTNASGNISTGTLTLFSGGAATVLLTDAANLIANSAGAVSLTDSGAVNIGGTNALASSSGSTFTVTNSAGTLSNAGTISGASVTLTAQTGNVDVNNTITGTANAGSVSLNANAGSVNINAPVQDTGTSGAVNVTATSLVNTSTVSGGTVQITAIPAQALSIINTGSITATSGNIEVDSAVDQNVSIGNNGSSTSIGSFNVSGSNEIIINANASGSASTNQIIFTGSQNLNTAAAGQTILNANTGTGQAVTVNGATSFATVTGNNIVLVNSSTINQPNGVLIGNPLIFNSALSAGTITDTTGNLILSSNLTFAGKSLAILATGNVTSSGPLTINLIGTNSLVNNGNGGNLSIIAGYDFTPATNNQSPVNGVFTITGPSSTGGSVSLGNVTITTGSTVVNANGGNVLVVASGANGLTGGSITLGTIDTSSTANGSTTATGGSVSLIGQGINVGNINTTANTGGNVTILGGAPTITGSIKSVNGNLSGGSFGAGPSFAGSITVAGINTGNGSVSLTAGTTISADPSLIFANALNLSAVGGSISLATNNVAVLANSITGNGGTINLTANTISGTGSAPLVLNAAGGATGTNQNGGTIVVVTNTASSTIGSSNGNFELVANGGGTSSNGGSVSFTNLGGTLAVDSVNGISIATGSTNGNGGSITLSATAISNVAGSGALVLNASGLGSGNGGSVAVNQTGSGAATIGTATGDFNLIANSGTFGSNGGSVNFFTAGALTYNAAGVTFGPLSTASSNGGSLALTAASLTNGAAGANLILSANGVGSGNGGSVSVDLTGTTAATIGTAAGQYQLQAKSGAGGGNGGSVSFTNADGNLTVAPAAIAVGPLGTNGNGGTITLQAGNASTAGNLLVTSALSASGKGTGRGGTINLLSNSGTNSNFNIGNTAATNLNGVRGGLTVAGKINGSVNVTNFNGSIADNTSIVAVGNVSLTAGGTSGSVTVGQALGTATTTTAVDLVATGSGNVTSTTAGAVVSGLTVTASSSTGTLGASSASLNTNTGSLTAITGGTVINIKNTGTSQLTLNASSVAAAGTFKLVTAGSLLIAGSIGGGSTLTLQSGAAGSIFAQSTSDLLTGTTISLTGGSGGVGSAGTNIQISAGTLLANSGTGGVYINSQGTGPLSVTGSNSSKVVDLTAAGNITVAGAIGTATTSVTIDTLGHGGVIIADLTAGVINGNSVTLVSASGSIGTTGASPSPLLVKATTLTANALGVINIKNTGTAALTINASGTTGTSGQTFTLVSAGNIVVGGSVNGGAALTLQTGTAGSITSLASSNVLTGTTVTLTSGSSGIGKTTSAVQVNSTNLMASSATGAAYINSTGSSNLNLSAVNTTSATGFNLTAVGNVTILGAVNGGTTAGINISAGGTGGILNGGGTIAGKVVTLMANSGSIGSGTTALDLQATTLTANASTAAGALVNINNTGTTPITLNASSANSAGSFQLVTSGNLIVGGAISGGTQVTLQSGASGSVTSTANTNVITATEVSLASGSGGIGSTSKALQVNTGSLLADSGAGAAYINSTSSANLNLIGANTTSAIGLNLKAVGDVTIAGNVGGGTLAAINITSSGADGILYSSGSITGNAVSLTATSGAIGTSGTALDNLTATTLTANASGLVNITDTASTALTLDNSSGASFSLATNGPTTLRNISASGIGGSAGNITVTDAEGLLQTATGSKILATNGAIVLNESDGTSGTIKIGTTNTVATSGTSGGNVSIFVGALPNPPVAGVTPTNVTTSVVGTGQIFFGITSSSTISANAPVNTLTAKNASLIFSTGTAPATAITLSGGDKITADPPGNGSVIVNAGLASLNSSGHAPALSDANQTFIATATGSGLAAASLASALPGTSATSSAAFNVGATRQFVNTSTATMMTEEPAWISDTELATGEVPALLSSEDDLGITPGVTVVVDLQAEPANDSSNGTELTSGQSLAGKVSVAVGKRKTVSLNRGSVVFAPNVDTEINTPFGTVNVAAQSLVLVMSFPSGLGVYDLHDSRRGAVKINAGGKELNLSPGMGAIVTNADVPGFENVNPAQLFGYRSIKTRDLGDNLKAFTAEFSLTQAIQCVQPLRQLVCAKQPTAQLVTNRLLKTTAIISALSAGGPQYQQILHTTQVDRIAATH